MRKLTTLLMVAALAFAGCSRPAAKAPTTEPPAAAAESAKDGKADQKADQKAVEAFGVVVATRTRDLIVDFPALVEKKLVEEGQKVKAGDALFRLSFADHAADINAAAQELAAARLALTTTLVERQKLQDELDLARTDEAKARKELDAKQKMLSIGAASPSDVQDFTRDLNAKEQAVRQLERSLASYAGTEQGSIEVQKAKIANLEEKVRLLKAKTSRSFISGDAIVCDLPEAIVSDIGYTVGDFVSRDKKLCTLMDVASILVQANVPEEFIKDVKIGSRAEISPLADSARTYGGTVTRIADLATKSNGETVIAVDIAIEKRDAFLRPSFNVDVKIH